jgi:hypothetical protein
VAAERHPVKGEHLALLGGGPLLIQSEPVARRRGVRADAVERLDRPTYGGVFSGILLARNAGAQNPPRSSRRLIAEDAGARDIPAPVSGT